MKLTIINYLGATVIAIFLLLACDAPESVRFGNSQHNLSKDLFASVPVDFMHYQIALGDTIEEVQNKLGFYLEMNDFEGYQKAEFKVNSISNSANSKVECVFMKQRLVSFKADFELKRAAERITDTLKALAKVQPSILNLRNELEKKGISFYSFKKLSEQVTFAFKMDKNNNYKGCVYQIAYPEFANGFKI